MPVITVGLITEYEQAEAIIAHGEADMVSLARGVLCDPRWPWHAAAHFGGQVQRAQPIPALPASGPEGLVPGCQLRPALTPRTVGAG